MVIYEYAEELAVLILGDLDNDEVVILEQKSVQIVGLDLYGNTSPHQILPQRCSWECAQKTLNASDREQIYPSKPEMQMSRFH